MNNVPLDIVIPIYNEGKKIVKLLDLIKKMLKPSTEFYFVMTMKQTMYSNSKTSFKIFLDVKLIKNPEKGPCSAIKEGISFGGSESVIVYPADDFINYNIIDSMYKTFEKGNDIVVASRFMKGGSMVGCPLLKSILVRLASTTLFFFSSIPVKDASNGFRLFSRKLLNAVRIEFTLGFAYSLELLAKCNRLGWCIKEIPAQWEERSEGSSRFKI